MLDLHVHSLYSVDGQETPEVLCGAAVAAGVSVLCISDHLDMNPQDYGFGFYREAACREDVLGCQRAYAGRLEVLWGVEMGEPHLFPKDMAALQDVGYDCILGSIHWIDGRFVSQIDDMDFLWRRYYGDMIASIATGGFDVLAHFDFPKRYHGPRPGGAALDALELSALQTAADAGLALEINTSTLRQGMQETAPGCALVARWAALGGQRVTVGSDAHTCGEVGVGVDTIDMAWLAGLGLQVGYFRQRVFVPWENGAAYGR